MEGELEHPYKLCPRISHNISTFLFCSFSFQISLESSVSVLYFLFIFNGLHIVTWTWSHWYCIKFYFYNSLLLMLHLPCTKRYYWDTYCLKDIWICLYSYMFLLELMFAGLLLSFYVSWILISWLAYNCS